MVAISLPILRGTYSSPGQCIAASVPTILMAWLSTLSGNILTVYCLINPINISEWASRDQWRITLEI